MSENHTITRRTLFVGTAAIAAGVVFAVPLVKATEASAVDADPAERLALAVAEYQAAALALYPDIFHWTVNACDAGVLVFGQRPAQPVKWSGPAAYETIDGDTRPVWIIARAPEYEHDGERWFSLSTGFKGKHEPADWFCPEHSLPRLTRKLRSIDA